MVTKDRPAGYCRNTRRCIAEYYSMGRTRGLVLKVLVHCSWNQYRNTWKYENVVPVVFTSLGASRILPGGDRDGFAHSPHSISFPLISTRDQLIKPSIFHLLHIVCCSEARTLRPNTTQTYHTPRDNKHTNPKEGVTFTSPHNDKCLLPLARCHHSSVLTVTDMNPRRRLPRHSACPNRKGIHPSPQLKPTDIKTSTACYLAQDTGHTKYTAKQH